MKTLKNCVRGAMRTVLILMGALIAICLSAMCVLRLSAGIQALKTLIQIGK